MNKIKSSMNEQELALLKWLEERNLNEVIEESNQAVLPKNYDFIDRVDAIFPSVYSDYYDSI